MIMFEAIAVSVGLLLVVSHPIERVPVPPGVLLGIAAGLGFGNSDVSNKALSGELDSGFGGLLSPDDAQPLDAVRDEEAVNHGVEPLQRAHAGLLGRPAQHHDRDVRLIALGAPLVGILERLAALSERPLALERLRSDAALLCIDRPAHGTIA